MKFYSIYDKQIAAFMPLFPARDRGEALRLATDAAADDGRFGKHLPDYALYEMFEFSDDTGRVVQSDNHPMKICDLVELVHRD